MKEKFAKLIDKVNLIMGSSIVAAGTLMFQGVMLLLNPTTAMAGLTQWTGYMLVLYAVTAYIPILVTKSFNRSNLASILLPIPVLAMGILFIIFSAEIGEFLIYFMAGIVVLIGIYNIIRIFHLDLMDAKAKDMRLAYEASPLSDNKTLQKANESLKAAATSQVSPFLKGLKRIKVTSWAYFAANLVLIGVGIGIAFTHFKNNDIVLRVSAILMILSSSFSIVNIIKSAIYEKRFSKALKQFKEDVDARKMERRANRSDAQ